MAETTRTKLLRSLAEGIDAATADAQVARQEAAAITADPAATAKAKKAAKKAVAAAEQRLNRAARIYNQTVKPARAKKKSEPKTETPAEVRRKAAAARLLDEYRERRNAALPLAVESFESQVSQPVTLETTAPSADALRQAQTDRPVVADEMDLRTYSETKSPLPAPQPVQAPVQAPVKSVTAVTVDTSNPETAAMLARANATLEKAEAAKRAENARLEKLRLENERIVADAKLAASRQASLRAVGFNPRLPSPDYQNVDNRIIRTDGATPRDDWSIEDATSSKPRESWMMGEPLE